MPKISRFLVEPILIVCFLASTFFVMGCDSNNSPSSDSDGSTEVESRRPSGSDRSIQLEANAQDDWTEEMDEGIAADRNREWIARIEGYTETAEEALVLLQSVTDEPSAEAAIARLEFLSRAVAQQNHWENTSMGAAFSSEQMLARCEAVDTRFREVRGLIKIERDRISNISPANHPEMMRVLDKFPY